MLLGISLPLVEFFTLSGLFGWLLLLGGFFLVSACMFRDSYMAATGFLVAVLVLFLLFGSLVPIVGGIEFSLMWVLKHIGGFILCGVVWGLFKYLVLFTSEIKDKYYDVKKGWLKKQGIEGDSVPEELKEKFAQHLMRNTQFHNGGKWGTLTTVRVKPDAWEHRDDITAWMVFWPFSLAETLLGDVLRIFYKRLQTVLGRFMNAMTDFMFRGIEKDWRNDK
jgi:hypothetical protein